MKDITEKDLTDNLPLTTARKAKTEVQVGNHRIKEGSFTVIAGPCAVEGEESIVAIAHEVKRLGAHLLRGGAFKPLTFPYRRPGFTELGLDGLKFLHQAGKESGLPVVTEVMDVRWVEKAAQYTDMIQIGARNMQNFPLLEEAAKTKKPILLKRHFGSSLRDWLGAAEYFLYHGNMQVVLCERGIAVPHTHMPTSRSIVDLQVVPAAKSVCHLPVFVDPSHSTFKREFVAPIARGALAVGADGILLDVHPVPEKAWVDPLQALGYPAFEELMGELGRMASALSKSIKNGARQEVRA